MVIADSSVANFLYTDTQENADLIAAAVRVEYDSLGPPIISTEDAVRANSYVENYKPKEVKVGDTASEWQ